MAQTLEGNLPALPPSLLRPRLPVWCGLEEEIIEIISIESGPVWAWGNLTVCRLDRKVAGPIFLSGG